MENVSSRALTGLYARCMLAWGSLRPRLIRAPVCLIPHPSGLVTSSPEGFLPRLLYLAHSPKAQILEAVQGSGKDTRFQAGILAFVGQWQEEVALSCPKGQDVNCAERWRRRALETGNIVFCFEKSFAF